MLFIVSILRLGEWSELPTPLDDDSRLRMLQCLQVLARPEPEAVEIWMQDCRASFATLTKDKILREAAEAKAQEKRVASQVCVKS